MNAEEELQSKIHNNESELDKTDPEIIAYKRVFQALSTSADYSVPLDFADVVIKKLEARQKRSVLQHDFLWLCLGVLLLLTGGAYTTITMKLKIDFGFLEDFAYKGVLVFGVCFVAALNYIDRRVRRSSGFRA